MAAEVGFSIGSASSQSGLSTHVIRAWERRYGAVSPTRSPTGRRLYSRADIHRLILLKNTVGKGYRISQISDLANDRLKELSGTDPEPYGTTGGVETCRTDVLLDDCMESVALLDSQRLHRQLQRGLLMYNRLTMVAGVIQPLLQRIGRQWAMGDARIVHGHLAAAVVHVQLSAMLIHRDNNNPEKPIVLVAAPAGQFCYLGALAITVLAQDHGFNAVFLGHNLPAEEIAAAATALMPQRIILSITCRINDGYVEDQMLRLAELLDGRFPLVVGGRAGHVYRRSVESNGGTFCDSAGNLFDYLNHGA